MKMKGASKFFSVILILAMVFSLFYPGNLTFKVRADEGIQTQTDAEKSTEETDVVSDDEDTQGVSENVSQEYVNETEDSKNDSTETSVISDETSTAPQDTDVVSKDAENAENEGKKDEAAKNENALKSDEEIKPVIVKDDKTMADDTEIPESKKLASVASDLSISSIKDETNHSAKVYPWADTDNPPEIVYGDELHVTLAWSFPNELIIPAGQVYTYQLPTGILFSDVTDNLVNNEGVAVGKYTISNNMVSIEYTDESFRIKDENRHGSLTMKSYINNDENGGQTDKNITYEFPDIDDITFHLIPKESPSKLEIVKGIFRVSPSDVPTSLGLDDVDKTHVYRTKIQIKSTGPNDNIVFRDKMWPGMTLLTAPEFYSDSNFSKPIDTSTFVSLDYQLKSDHIDAEIPAMADGEEIWVTYLILIDRDMYSMDTANAFIAKNDPDRLYPSTGYPGKVSNKATVKSDQCQKAPDGDDIRSWGAVGTITGAIDKWASRPNHNLTLGILAWQVILKNIAGTDYRTGYVVDYIPENLALIDDSVVCRDYDSGAVVPGMISIESKEAQTDGTTKVVFRFSADLIETLKTPEKIMYIQYNTKVTKQAPGKHTYTNKAEIYYDDNKIMDVSADESYILANELEKGVTYTALTAPYAYFVINVNNAATDMDEETDEIILEDEMSDVYDLLIDSVEINGVLADSSIFTYDIASRKMTFRLQDKTRYVIHYTCRVNLDPGPDKLTYENSWNNVKLYADHPGGHTVTNGVKFKEDVFSYAGTSVSDKNPATLNVYKYKDGDLTSLLGGAEFKLTKMSGLSTLTATDTVYTKSTGNGISVDNTELGLAAFKGLDKGVIYMLEETKAPENYTKDSTLRFYAFKDSKVTLNDTVTYNGRTYTLNQIDADRSSYDLYISNKLQPKTIQILKVDENGDALSGATLVISDNDGNVVTWISGTTASRIDVIPGNTYSLKETDAPENYEGLGNDAVTFTVNTAGEIELTPGNAVNAKVEVDSNNKSLLKVVNTKKLGSLRFTKTLSGLDDNSLADNIIFNVYKLDSRGSVTGSPIATFKYADIKADGYKQIDDLELGTYRVSELSTSINKYNFLNLTTETSADVTVTGNNTANNPALVSLNNTYAKQVGAIRITKTITGPITENDKENLTFTVTDDNNKTVWEGRLGDTSKFELQRDGSYQSVLISNLDIDRTYKVTETLYDVTGLTETVTYSINGAEEKNGASTESFNVKGNETTNVAIKDVYVQDVGSIKIVKTISGPITDHDKENLTFTVTDEDNKTVWEGKLGDTTKFTEMQDGTFEAVIENLNVLKTYSVTETLYDISGLTVTVTHKVNGGTAAEGSNITGVKVDKDKTSTVEIFDVYEKKTTEETTTEETTTEEPKTEEPKTEEPKTEEPTTEQPKTEETTQTSGSSTTVTDTTETKTDTTTITITDPKTPSQTVKKDTSAKTGDSFMGVIAMIFMLIAMIYIVAFGVYKRRKNRNDK